MHPNDRGGSIHVIPGPPHGSRFPATTRGRGDAGCRGSNPPQGAKSRPHRSPRHSPPGATRNVFPCRKPRGRVSLSNRNGGAPGRVSLKVAEQVAKIADEGKAIEDKLATWH